MDASLAAILGSLGGALVGGPVGYLFERFAGRARIIVQYAETVYEDVVSLSLDVQQNIGRYNLFIEFVESQVQWLFLRRVKGNLFSREELRVLQELATHFLDYQGKMLNRLKRDAEAVKRGRAEDLQRLAAEL